RRIIDDPGLDRSVTLDCRHHQLAHLGQDPLVRPLSLADEMQQLLMLRRNLGRRRHRRHRLNALAAFSRQKSDAIIPQRHRPIGMPDHARQFLDKSHKAIGSIRYRFETHLSPPPELNLAKYLILNYDQVRLSDSGAIQSDALTLRTFAIRLVSITAASLR